MSMRVRFAPSPTGYLHVGGGRTALFNWLWARKHGGTYILRIEDTDRERSNDANTRSILDGLAWLGLDHDEGPYFQSEGIERHVAVAQQLLAEGKAYRSFLTPAELEAQRKQAEAEKRTWLRDQEGRDRSPEESQGLADAGEPFAIRFRVPEGVVRFDDAVYGAQQRSHQDIEDFALLRPDGTPLYNHVVVCDDVHMRITDIIRGQDHLSNTHKQVLLYQAMGRTPAEVRAPAAHQRARPDEAQQAQARAGRLGHDLPRPRVPAGSVPQLPGPARLVRRATTARSTRHRSSSRRSRSRASAARTPSSRSPRPTRACGPTARRCS